MLEREMEDLIAEFPDDFDCFHGKGLVLMGRQKTLPGFGRFDLLFEDRRHNKILMELKLGRTQVDEVMLQIDRYRDALENQGIADILMYVVATEIPKPHRRMLNNAEIECCEISEAEFRRVARKRNYLWLAHEPQYELGTIRTTKVQGGGGRSRFIDQKPPHDHTFQWVYVPLIRNEFSIEELTDLLLKGIDDRPQDDKLLNKLLGAGILDRSKEEKMLKELFRAGIYDKCPDPTDIRQQIIKWLGTGLDLKPTERRYPWFTYVEYTIAGTIVPLTGKKDLDRIEDNEAIRIICRPKWFDDNGKNPEMKYYGGDAESQEVFYGKDGRFPLRQGTVIPGNVT